MKIVIETLLEAKHHLGPDYWEIFKSIKNNCELYECRENWISIQGPLNDNIYYMLKMAFRLKC